MSKKILKLYRGISSAEFNFATEEVIKLNKETWSSILALRVKGNFKFPENLASPIRELHKNLRLEYQYFTDLKVVAEGYARKVGGLLMEISVPVEDVLKYFDTEFQNFSQRKKQFEIVYRVQGSILAQQKTKWRLKVRRKK